MNGDGEHCRMMHSENILVQYMARRSMYNVFESWKIDITPVISARNWNFSLVRSIHCC